jgi:hypothetical protein
MRSIPINSHLMRVFIDRPCSSGTSNYRNLHLIPNLDSCVSARIQHKTYRPFGTRIRFALLRLELQSHSDFNFPR